MAQKLTTSSDFIIRPLEGDTELDMFHRLSAITFNPQADPDEATPRFRKLIEGTPDFQPQQLRGAFSGNILLGGYLIQERQLRIGSAHLPTGCIGNIVTLTEHRNKGIATALLQDALSYAQAHHLALLLLDGIPNFYHRFGFIDVLDLCRHNFDRQAVQALPLSPYQLRLATLEDAPALLALYQRHYATHTGGFTRTLAQQEHLLRWRYPEPPIVVVSPDHLVCGYMKTIQRPNQLFAYELAADNWHATLALLHYHADMQQQTNEQENDLSWSLPIDAPTLDLLTDHLTVRSQVYHAPNADWMARAIHIPTLLQAMLPHWNKVWQSFTPTWTGIIALHIGDDSHMLVLDDTSIHLAEPSVIPVHHVRLSQQVFTQLLFGYRPVSWAIHHSGQHIPKELLPLFNRLFPRGYAWINGSDAF